MIVWAAALEVKPEEVWHLLRKLLAFAPHGRALPSTSEPLRGPGVQKEKPTPTPRPSTLKMKKGARTDALLRRALTRAVRSHWVSVLDVELFTFCLPDFLEHLAEPGLIDVEGFAALDARELDGAQPVLVVLVVTDDAGFAA